MFYLQYRDIYSAFIEKSGQHTDLLKDKYHTERQRNLKHRKKQFQGGTRKKKKEHLALVTILSYETS